MAMHLSLLLREDYFFSFVSASYLSEESLPKDHVGEDTIGLFGPLAVRTLYTGWTDLCQLTLKRLHNTQHTHTLFSSYEK
jgi:hypothetical protein